MLPNNSVISVQSLEVTSIAELAGRCPMVIDFWHTNCSRCPAALSKLDDIATAYPSVRFVACALSLGDGNFDIVRDAVSGYVCDCEVFNPCH